LNVTLSTLYKVFGVLGYSVSITLSKEAHESGASQ
jgi:hypothetical protein